MADDKNAFGGGNAHSLYTPMSEDEQEVLERLLTGEDLYINIVGWGQVNLFDKVTLGDLRLAIQFTAAFNRPPVPVPVHYFDLELVVRGENNWVLASDRLPTIYDKKPIQIGAGDVLTMVWDIAIRKMDPRFVKLIKPGALGLTTAEGNRKLDAKRQELFRKLREAEAVSKVDDAKKRARASALENAAIRDGLLKKKKTK